MVKNSKSAKSQFKKSPRIRSIRNTRRSQKNNVTQITLKTSNDSSNKIKRNSKNIKNQNANKITYENIKIFPNFHSSTLIYMKIMNNKKYFLTASDYHLIIYSLETMKKISTATNFYNPWTHCLEMTTGEIVCLNLNNVIFYKYDNYTKHIIEVKNLIYQTPKFSKGLYQIDGRTIAVCKEKEVYLLDTHNYNVKNTIKLHYDCKSCLFVDYKETLLMMSENKIEIIDLLLKENIGKIYDAGIGLKKGLNLENNKILIHNFQGIKIYDSNTFKKLNSILIKEGISIVKKLNFNNNLIAIGDSNGGLKFIDYNCNLIYEVNLSKVGINCLFCLTDNKILFNLNGGRIVLFDVEKKSSIYVKKVEGANALRKGFLLDDGTLILGYCKSFVLLK